MAKVLTDESNYEDIADAIREKNGSSNTYLPSEMAEAVRDIPTGGAVQSVNGKTGAVVLDASDVGAGTYSKPSGGIPKSDLASAVQTSLGKADTALQTAPVTKVNNKTGAVTLNAADVGAKAVQTPVSDPSSSGVETSFFDFISNIAQDAQGVISATKKSILAADSTRAGVMSSQQAGQLMDAANGVSAAQFNFAPSADFSGAYPIKAGTLFTYRSLSNAGQYLHRALVDIASLSEVSDETCERVKVSDLYNELLASILAAYPTPTASGATVSIADGSDDLPIKSLLVNIKPAQSGSGTPSPTNVRAISGWTEASIAIQHDGTKMLFVNWETEAGEVYGGSLDVINGILTVNFGVLSSTFGELIDGSGTAPSGYALKNLRLSQDFPSNTWLNDTVCNIATPSSTSNAQNVVRFSNDKTFCIFTLPTNLDSNTPVMVVYPLAVPKTYTLDPMEVLTALGENIFSADCGDVSVTYRADPTLFASKGQTEDDMTANAPIAIGKYFQIGNTLYRATAAIATGETIAPEINCVVTNLAEALNLLNI